MKNLWLLVTIALAIALGILYGRHGSGPNGKPQVISPVADLVADFGADPSGQLDATEAFRRWFAMGCLHKKALRAPSGTFTMATGVVWDFAPCPYGLDIVGLSHSQTVFRFVGSGTGFHWKVSGGTSPVDIAPHVYDRLSNVTIACDTPDVCFKLGQDNGADVFESSEFSNIYVTNVNATPGAVAWRINGANANVFSNIQAGVLPATESSPGNGIAVQLTMAAFNTFINASVGNANIGIQFTDLDNPTIGFSYSDTFLNLDIENVQWGLILDNKANSATTRIKVDQGVAYTIYPSGALFANRQKHALECCGNLIVSNVHAGLNPLYELSGKGRFIDPAHWRGIQVVGSYGAPPTTLTLPGSMAACSTNMVTNTTGQTQLVTIAGGAFSAVCWRQLTYPVSSTYSFPLEPGDQFGVTYTLAPTVTQVPMH